MATITKRGKAWFVQVRRKRVSKSASFPTKGQATAWATHTEAEILSGTYKRSSRKTFADAVDRYLEEVTPHKRAPDRERYILDIIRRAPFASMPVGEITTEILAQYRDTELKRLKPGSVTRYLGMVGVVFEQMRREWQWVKVNPAKELRKPSSAPARDRIFTDEEITALVDELIYTDIQRTIAAMLIFAIETAMRRGEIIGLQWSDIDMEKRTATLTRTKNNDKRVVPLSSKAIEVLEGRKEFDRPFKVIPETLTRIFGETCKRLGIEGATFHDTRHTAITKLSKKVSPFELARIAGHRDMSMTLRYFNESAEEMAKKLD